MNYDKNSIHLDKIGARIRYQREKHKLSRETFAEMVGLSPFYIGQIERDERSMSIDTLIKICDILNVSTDYILRGYMKYMENILVQETFENNYSENMDKEVKELLSTLSGSSKDSIKIVNDLVKLILPNLIK